MKLIVLGLITILIGAFIFFFYPVIKAEYNLFLLDRNNFKINIVYVEKKARQLTPINNQFGIVINKIGANGKIIDYADALSVQYVLANGPVHLSNSAYPGEMGNIIIISNTPGDWYKYTRSNPEFYLMYKLVPGDIIQVFYRGEQFDYSVINSYKISEDKVKNFITKSDQKLLTILSGWPPGTTILRLVIQAKMIN